jgi:TrpR family trp operon transcriptional repressor
MTKQSAEEGWWRFLKLCTKIKTANEFEELFDLFLTIEEKEALAARFLIVQELLEGKKTQRDIADDLHVSISKITRGSNALKIVSQTLRETLKAKGG